ncbi:hypothetical protein LTR22_026776 [Elasticomyces elasticus]|nr:hypothetical protein LTR22_026776 [Elasticomyces elasticus]
MLQQREREMRRTDTFQLRQQAQQQGGEKSQEELKEEKVVMVYVKKQSLLEDQRRREAAEAKGKGKAPQSDEHDTDDEETKKAMKITLAQTQQPLYSTYDFNPLEHLAGIAPYFEPSDPPRDSAPPQGCYVTKAAYLVRHAAINANDFDYESYLGLSAERLENSTVDWSKIPSLAFLDTWTPPTIKEEERVTRTGKLEAAQLGVQISYRYPSLRLPKRVWASSAERTTVSAQVLIRGLEMEDNDISLVEIYEPKEGGADSLTPYSSCPAYSSSAGPKQQSTYVKKYTAPILDFQDLWHYLQPRSFIIIIIIIILSIRKVIKGRVSLTQHIILAGKMYGVSAIRIPSLIIDKIGHSSRLHD